MMYCMLYSEVNQYLLKSVKDFLVRKVEKKSRYTTSRDLKNLFRNEPPLHLIKISKAVSKLSKTLKSERVSL